MHHSVVIGVGSSACAVRVTKPRCLDDAELSSDMKAAAVLLVPFHEGNDIREQRRIVEEVDPESKFTPKFASCKQSPASIADARSACAERLTHFADSVPSNKSLTLRRAAAAVSYSDLEAPDSRLDILQQDGGFEATTTGMEQALDNGNEFSLQDLLLKMTGLFDAIDMMSQKNYMHMNIQPPNVLLQFKDGALDRLLLIDFANTQTVDAFMKMPSDDAIAAARHPYMPPEIMAAAVHGLPCVRGAMLNPLTHSCTNGCGCPAQTMTVGLFGSYTTFAERMLNRKIKPLYEKAGLQDFVHEIRDVLMLSHSSSFFGANKMALLTAPLVSACTVNTYGVGLTIFEMVTNVMRLLLDYAPKKYHAHIHGVLFAFLAYFVQPYLIGLLPAQRIQSPLYAEPQLRAFIRNLRETKARELLSFKFRKTRAAPGGRARRIRR